MQTFKSKIGNSLGVFFVLTIVFFALLYLMLFFTLNFRLTQISLIGWLGIAVFYCMLSYIYAGLTNNDVLVFDDRVEIVNRIPLFARRISFQFDKIKSVQFKHEWQATFAKKVKPKLLKYILTEWIAPFFFPTDYKWIRISTNKNYQFNCFGIEMDYYDNEGPLFEGLFTALAEKGVNVSWTNTTDAYYLQMMENVEQKKANPKD